jgi:hypothetical protein
LVWQQAVKGTFVPSSKLISSFFFFVVFWRLLIWNRKRSEI